MESVLTNTEFFSFENEVWVRTTGGEMSKLKETDYAFVSIFAEFIETFYPKAFKALCDEYKGCQINQSYFRFRIVSRFVKCNFSELDTMPDIDRDLNCNFEYVNCPLRGECRHDGVICNPEFNHRLSAAEMRVMSLIYSGMSEEESAVCLHLSPLTIHTHIHNAYKRLGIHSRTEFVKYATKNNLFK